jgi:hypothetical protein
LEAIGSTNLWGDEIKGPGTMARLFAQPNIPRVTKALTAESALQCWKELTNELILSAWEFDDEGEDDETYVDVEYWHDDIEQEDLDLMEMGWKWNDRHE